jgi:PadR family transcriptional regulator, regulatory protein PadR
MRDKKHLGEFEQLVLLAILQLRDEAYGMKIRAEIKKKANRLTSLGAIYTTLERLETKGLVTSWTGEPTPERGGRAKKFFKVEAAGQRALRDAFKASVNMSSGLPLPVLGGAQ